MRVSIAFGKFHGVIAAVLPIGCSDGDDAAVALRRGNRVAVDAPRLVGEPFDERRRIDDLAARFGKRFALLGGEDQPRSSALESIRSLS